MNFNRVLPVIMILMVFVLGFSHAGQSATLVDKMRSIRPDLNEDRFAKLVLYFEKYIDRYDANENRVLAVVKKESGLVNEQSHICRGTMDRYCEEPAKRELSCGLFQMNHRTFREVMGYWPAGNTDVEKCRALIYDYERAIQAGVKHIVELRQRHGPYDWVSAYNAGVPVESNSEYVEKVMENYNEFKRMEYNG